MTQTIQLTSKKLKGHLLISGLVMVLGGVIGIGGCAALCDTTATVGGVGFLAGLTGWIVTKFRIWWHHK